MGKHVLQEISMLKGEPLSSVLQTVGQNTVKIYGLEPWWLQITARIQDAGVHNSCDHYKDWLRRIWTLFDDIAMVNPIAVIVILLF